MKALTVHQPWAKLIVSGLKRIENRIWPTSHRGPLLIHAGKSRASLGLHETGADPSLTFGAIVGVVDVVNCVPVSEVAGEEFAEGPWCWVLANAIRLDEPIACDGLQGLWTPVAGVVESCRGCMERPGRARTAISRLDDGHATLHHGRE